MTGAELKACMLALVADATSVLDGSNGEKVEPYDTCYLLAKNALKLVHEIEPDLIVDKWWLE